LAPVISRSCSTSVARVRLCGNHGGRGLVVCGLRFFDIGDGDESHFEALVGLPELIRDRLVG